MPCTQEMTCRTDPDLAKKVAASLDRRQFRRIVTRRLCFLRLPWTLLRNIDRIKIATLPGRTQNIYAVSCQITLLVCLAPHMGESIYGHIGTTSEVGVPHVKLKDSRVR